MNTYDADQPKIHEGWSVRSTVGSTVGSIVAQCFRRLAAGRMLRLGRAAWGFRSDLGGSTPIAVG
jgi:hypothetical protein